MMLWMLRFQTATSNLGQLPVFQVLSKLEVRKIATSTLIIFIYLIDELSKREREQQSIDRRRQSITIRNKNKQEK